MKIFLDDERLLGSMNLNPSEWTHVKTAKEAFDFIMTGEVTVASLDHDLGSGCPEGSDLMNWIEKAVYRGELKKVPTFFFHTQNPEGKKRMKAALRSILKELNG